MRLVRVTPAGCVEEVLAKPVHASRDALIPLADCSSEWRKQKQKWFAGWR